MGKWLVLLLFALVVYFVVKAGRSRSQSKSPAPRLTEDMVACEHCGVHLPRSESIEDRGRFFCCKDHAFSDGN